MHWSLALCSAALVAGCAVPPAPITGAQNAPVVAATTPAATLAWNVAPGLLAPRDHHAVFVVRVGNRSFLYAAGGTNYRDMFATVERAELRPDGSLGPWTADRALPSERAGSSVAVAGSWIVLTGGQIAADTGSQRLPRIADVFTARVGPDGTIGEWLPAAPLPAPRFHHPAVQHEGWIYVVGGQGRVEAGREVYGAKISTDGKLSDWVELTPLPRARSHHAALVHQGHLYVVGGLDGIPGGMQGLFNDVLRAPIRADGSLGDWRVVSRVPHTIATHSAIVLGNRLCVVGGVEDNLRFVSSVWCAEFGANDRLGAWQQIEPGLPIARGPVHETPVVDGRIYSVGGRLAPAEGQTVPVTGAAHVGSPLPRD